MNGNPQVENGYTKISNELLEAISKALAKRIISGQEASIVFWIIRYTYGFQRKENFFKIVNIAKELGFSLSWTIQLIKKLKNKKIIIEKEKNEFAINKHYLEWAKRLEQTKVGLEQTKVGLEQTKPDEVEETKINKGVSEEILDPLNKYIKKNIIKENINSLLHKESAHPENLENLENSKNFSLNEEEKEEKNIPHAPARSPADRQIELHKEAIKLIYTFADLRGIEADNSTIPKNIRSATKLLKQYPFEVIMAGIVWRLNNDRDNFWNEKLWNLNTVYSHFAEWIAEAKLDNKKKTFMDWIVEHPEWDYRKLEDEAKAKAFFEAFKRALKDGITPTEEEWDKYNRAMKYIKEVINVRRNYS